MATLYRGADLDFNDSKERMTYASSDGASWFGLPWIMMPQSGDSGTDRALEYFASLAGQVLFGC